MATNNDARWQPSGIQFAYACRVCRHSTEIASDICKKCLSEAKSGFEFDHRTYMVNQAKLDDKKRTFCQANINELNALKEDRDYWMKLAESAIQQIKRMAERKNK